MTLVQSNKGKWVLRYIIGVSLSLIIDMYYLRIINHNTALGFTINDLFFVITLFLTAPLVIATRELLKKCYDEKARQKIADRFGYTGLIALSLIGVFMTETAPLWISDLLVQIQIVGTIGSLTITPKKGSYVTGAVCALITLAVIIVYFPYRF